jgi:hypothetical protein
LLFSCATNAANNLVEVDLAFEFDAQAHHAIAHANVDHRGRSPAAQRRPPADPHTHGSRAAAFETTPKEVEPFMSAGSSFTIQGAILIPGVRPKVAP